MNVLGSQGDKLYAIVYSTTWLPFITLKSVKIYLNDAQEGVKAWGKYKKIELIS